jgi:uncharacterized protein (DUF1697 family)
MINKNENRRKHMVFIALLRGINVGGKNMIKMAELKKALEDAGLGCVQTYIQSGNVLFCSEKDELSLRNTIENAIQAQFGLSVPVVLRTASQIYTLIANLPFSDNAIAQAQTNTDAEVLYVALLSASPSDERIAQVLRYKNADEQMLVVGRDVYLLLSGSIRHSKLAGHLGELDDSATVRNWKTITKLAELAKAMTP